METECFEWVGLDVYRLQHRPAGLLALDDRDWIRGPYGYGHFGWGFHQETADLP